MANKNFKVKNGLDVAGSATIDNDLTVTGNLTVNGDTTTLNTATLSVEDNIVILNSGVTGTPSLNAGIEVERGTSANTLLRWNESTDKWQFTNDGTTYYDMVTADTNTTYSQNASSTTGGANLNLVGSDSTTDAVKFASGTGVTVSRTDADTITITNAGVTSLAAGTYLSADTSTGSVTVSTNATNANTSSTIVARDSSGNFSAGTITANLANGDRVLGSLTASLSTTYTFPAPFLTTMSDNNGIDAVSSYNNSSSSSLGNGAQGQFTHYYGDTFAGGNTGAVFSLRTANGNSELTGTIPFTGLSPSAPSAVTSANVIGGMNFNGYATTGFTDYVASQNQGGGFQALHAGQVQFAPAETFADSTLTISGATITAVSRVNVTQTVTSVSGTKGQLTIPSTLVGVGTAVVVTGTNSGTSTGISAGTYYVVANNGGASNSTSITLSATVGGAPITTTAGTTNGLTFTRQLITVTYSAQSYIPFGSNAKIAVSGFTNVSTGTFMAIGAPTTTSVTIGATSSGTPSLSGSQSLSLTTVTAGAATFRVRGFPAATPLNNQNRVDLINASAATATHRSDTFIVAGGAYGNTGTSRFEISDSKILNKRPHRSDVTTASIARGATYTPAAGVNNFIELTLTSGTDPTYIDIDNLTVAGEGGHQAILVYNNSGSTVGNGDIRIRNNGTQISDNTGTTIANGARIIFTIYCIGNYASCEYMTAA